MNQNIIRPKVSDLIFHLYNKPLHPEFLDTLAIRKIRREDYSLTVRMIPTGHVIEWKSGANCLTELTTTGHTQLPNAGQCLTHRFQGEQRGRWRIAEELSYQICLQVEILQPEVFLHVHEELAVDGAKRGLIFHFRPQHRLGLTPMGFVTAESIPAGLSISAFHTFPDEFALIKTQSLIEFV